MKVCRECHTEKELSCFRYYKQNGRDYWRPYCNECQRAYRKKQYHNKERSKFHEDYSNPQIRSELLAKNKKFRDANKVKIKEYRKARADKDLENLRNWKRKKRAEDPSYKLRESVSHSIFLSMKKSGASKRGSIIDKLPYKVEDLKLHLESQFEPWMNWSNHGSYRQKTWNDNDQSTWTWQIDHIIPHSDLPYDSMDHPNFLKCWSLENLRPLSSKENLLDGSTRARHKTILSIAA